MSQWRRKLSRYCASPQIEFSEAAVLHVVVQKTDFEMEKEAFEQPRKSPSPQIKFFLKLLYCTLWY